MKIWQAILLPVLLLTASVLSACGASEQQEAYQKAVQDAQQSYQQQVETYQKEVEEYQKELEQAYRDYAGNLTRWYDLQRINLEAQLKQREQ